MKPITYHLNFPLARQIQDCLDRLSTDQKIELAFAIGQRALDEKRSADVIRRDMERIALVEMSIEEDDNYPDFPCDDFLTSRPITRGQQHMNTLDARSTYQRQQREAIADSLKNQ
jgi:hypothetical protein